MSHHKEDTTIKTIKGNKTIRAVDLFCGAGGTSSGLYNACHSAGYNLDLLAIDHWDVAVMTHKANHPEARHLCASLESVNPNSMIQNRHLDIMVASPECTNHSIARGSCPIRDQSRVSAWYVLKWAEALRIDNILIENVKEFREWGPIGSNDKPLKSRKGETYQAFLNALRSLGYSVEDRIVNAADYGDPTTRQRLFIMARRGRREIQWPAATHSKSNGLSLFGDQKPWKAAKEIIDWSLQGQSIFHRKRPLAPNTLKRIAVGLNRFGGKSFLVKLYGTGTAQSVDLPLPTVTAGGNHLALAEPFITGLEGQSTVKEISKPVPTIPDLYLCEPFIVKYYGTGKVQGINNPLGTITTKDRFGLVQTSDDQKELDIRFRMLQPHELAAAMSFGAEYQFSGTRSDQIRQIGNAVPVRTAEALCGALLAA